MQSRQYQISSKYVKQCGRITVFIGVTTDTATAVFWEVICWLQTRLTN
jgi:hypothetical protein